LSFQLNTIERDFHLTATTKNIVQTAVLCIGLLSANMVWSEDCPEGVKGRNATYPDVAQAQPLSASHLYEMFHDARLNESDGLGDYVHNFQATRPPRH
jgi:hypothetical protein